MFLTSVLGLLVRLSFQTNIALIFSLGLLYGHSLSIGGAVADSISTIFFVAVSTSLYVFLYAKFRDQTLASSKSWPFFLSGIALPLGLALGTNMAGTIADFFWIPDSIETHVPSAKIIAGALSGSLPQNIDLENLLKKPGVLTHLWVGIWFALFGASAFVSTLSLIVVKLGTLVVLGVCGKLLFDVLGSSAPPRLNGRALGIGAWLPYAAAPTVLFYTMAMYKEAVVHLLMAGAIAGLLLNVRKPSYFAITVLAVSLAGLAIERFYLTALCSPFLAYVLFICVQRRQFIKGALILFASIFCILLLPLENYSVELGIAYMRDLRAYHAAFPGISFRYNYEINYGVAVLKTLFTPIWAPNKLEMFSGASALITWGSFVHQAIVITYLLGVLKAVRSHGLLHVLIQVPFILFLLFAAYLSPWAGRIRDSFYPMISMYSFWYIATQLEGDWLFIKRRLKLF